MFMPTPEQVGNIVARLAIADEAFLRSMLEAAGKAGDRMLPEDAEHLQSWGRLMRALRASIRISEDKARN